MSSRKRQCKQVGYLFLLSRVESMTSHEDFISQFTQFVQKMGEAILLSYFHRFESAILCLSFRYLEGRTAQQKAVYSQASNQNVLKKLRYFISKLSSRPVTLFCILQFKKKTEVGTLGDPGRATQDDKIFWSDAIFSAVSFFRKQLYRSPKNIASS